MQNLAMARCEISRELLRDKGPVTQRALEQIQGNDLHLLTPDLLAARLKLSRATLYRRLREEGTNYQQLLDNEVSYRAIRLMSLPDSNVALIAAQLGYAEPVCFRRAFRRWFGVSPSQYRQNSTHQV